MRLGFELTLTCFVLLSSHALAAQNPTKSSTTAMHAGRWTYHAWAENGKVRQEIGERTVTVSDTLLDGARAWLIVTRMEIGGQIVADSVAFAADDHRPLLRDATLGDTRVSIEVPRGDSMARGLVVGSHFMLPLNVRLGANSFLNCYALRAMLPDVPLAPGWTGIAQTLELGTPPRFVSLRLVVEGDERLKVDAGAYDCWVVRVTGEGGIDEKYWVSKQDHYVVRTREPIGNNGSVLQLDLIAFSNDAFAETSSKSAQPSQPAVTVSAKIPFVRDSVIAAARRVFSELGYTLDRADAASGEMTTLPKLEWPAGSADESWHGSTSPGVSLTVRVRSVSADSTDFSVIATSPTRATSDSAKVSETLSMLNALEFANAISKNLGGTSGSPVAKP